MTKYQLYRIIFLASLISVLTYLVYFRLQSFGEKGKESFLSSNHHHHFEVSDSKTISCISASRFQNMSLLINATKERIWNQWDVSNYPLFLNMMHVPSASWDLQTAKFVRLILEEIEEEREGEGEGQQQQQQQPANARRFIAGFSGSSVTAGHDSYIHEAYPSVFEAAMRPVLQAGGIHFEVHNQAVGNNPCLPYDQCIATHVVGVVVDV